MRSLEICLLGPADLRSENESVRIPRRRTRAILIYLAVTRRPQSQSHLATLLWGDTSDHEATRNLSDALYPSGDWP